MWGIQSAKTLSELAILCSKAVKRLYDMVVELTTKVDNITTINPDDLSSEAVGSIKEWPVTDSIPVGWFLLNGQAISRTTYSQLFDLIGTNYGPGDGSTTFNLENREGLVPRGIGTQSINGRDKVGPTNIGDKQEDQFQGHFHNYASSSSSSGGSNRRPVVATNSSGTIAETVASGQASVREPSIDNTPNGTPRVGEETRVSSFGTIWIIKAANTSNSTTTQAEVDVLNADLQSLDNKYKKRYIVNTYSSGNDWYEVYNDGWVKQGQYYHQAGATTYSRTFLVSMDGSRYSLKTSPHMDSSSRIQYRSFGYSFTSSGFSAYTGTSTDFISWQLEGWGESSAVIALGATPNY